MRDFDLSSDGDQESIYLYHRCVWIYSLYICGLRWWWAARSRKTSNTTAWCQPSTIGRPATWNMVTTSHHFKTSRFNCDSCPQIQHQNGQTKEGLACFTQLVKVRGGNLVLALSSIRFSWNFYHIISGTKYEWKTCFGPITCNSWQENGKKTATFSWNFDLFWHFKWIVGIFMFQTVWIGVPQAGHT